MKKVILEKKLLDVFGNGIKYLIDAFKMFGNRKKVNGKDCIYSFLKIKLNFRLNS